MNDFVSFTRYLASERDTTQRREYVAGQAFTMADSTEQHNTIRGTLCTAIENTLREECRVWQSDMKVIGHNKNKDFAYYPDIMAACGENTDDPYYRTNPILIVEVLSPSTKRTDMSEKLDNYTAIDSLLEYVIVSQDTPYLAIYRRRNHWKMESFYAEDTFTLESVGLTLEVQQIYRRVRREVGLDVPYPSPK